MDAFLELWEPLARIELVLALLAIGLGLLLPKYGNRLYRYLIGAFRGRPRGWHMYVAAFLFPVLLRLALLPVLPVPVPSIQEEFSNLLLADTLAHGRVSNPPHPMAVFFEGTQMLQHPRYVSVRPLGDGALMAVAQLLTGVPWLGVVAANGFMCLALCWMLVAIFPRPWPILGAIVLALRMSVFTLFANSYWGQALAATGGMLVLGAAFRVMRKGWRLSYAGFALAGIVLLATTRVYEGGVACIVLGIAAIWSACGDWSDRTERQSFLKFAGVLAAGCLLLAGGLALYNYKTSGTPLKPAYVVWRSSQSIVPTFVFQKVDDGQHAYYNVQDMQFYTEFELGSYRFVTHSAWFYVRGLVMRATDVHHLYLRPLLLPGLLVGLLIRRSPAKKLAIAVLVAGALGQMLLSFGMPIYEAPYLGAAYVLVLAGIRKMALVSPKGASMAVALGIGVVVLFGLQVRAAAAHENFLPEDPWYHYGYASRQMKRAEIAEQFAHLHGKQLAIVRYKQEHPCILEWVWNGAQPDEEKIVWARELEPASTAALVSYYRDRTPWLVQVNGNEAVVSRYPIESLPAPRMAEDLYRWNTFVFQLGHPLQQPER